jgi:nucleotide-binding universal stress UspA family protein
MKKILLLTDFSKNSINAIYYAINLFKGEGCTYHLLHVKNLTSYTTDDMMSAGNESIYDSIIKDSKNELVALVTNLKQKYKTESLSIETIIDYDVFTDAIKQAVKANDIDLIVMGTNGVTGAKEVVFGSNTINVIRSIDCPTLVVPEGYAFRKTNGILLALDAQDALSGDAFNKASEFAKRFSEKLHVLRIKPNNENSSEEKKDKKHIDYFLENMNYEYHIVNEIPMHHVVNCYIQTHEIDLMLLLVQHEGFLERFFIGSPTTEIGNAIRVPLLVVHS